jgi:dihydrodipicolinate synthase/N-acetylneuraminate lyase
MEKRFPQVLLCTACIPWTEDNQLDVPLFRKGVELLCENGAGSIYLFGTAGEGYAVDRAQYTQIVSEFMDVMRNYPDVIPMVGIITMSMTEMMERVRLAADLGARYFQISFPNWGAVTDEEADIFLKTVCGAFPDYSFMHYNNSLRSKKRLAPKDYARLAKEIPNLVAVKFIAPSFNEIHEFAEMDLPIRIFFLEYAYGYGSLVYHGFSYLASALNCSYKTMCAYFEAGKNQDLETILRIHNDMPICYDVLYRNLPSGKIDSAYDKVFLQFSIPEFPPRILPPYQGCTQAQVDGFKADLRKALPHWFD